MEKGATLLDGTVKENLEDYALASSSISPLGGGVLGPIGPPGPIAPPSRPVKTANSPLTQQVSPQRSVQTPPIPKSPLLGHAPPGYFPFPEKGERGRDTGRYTDGR